MQTLIYNAQCSNGHVMEIIPGTELEELAKARAERDFLDAVCLTADECPECVEDRRERAKRTMRELADFGCWLHEPASCPPDCESFTLEVIADSPYADQVTNVRMPTMV